jgi:hypothetical protein
VWLSPALKKGIAGELGERELRFCVKREAEDKDRASGQAPVPRAILDRFFSTHGHEAAFL